MSQLCYPKLQNHVIVKRSVDLKSGVMRYRTLPASISNMSHCIYSHIIFFGLLSHAEMGGDVGSRSSYSSTQTQLVHQENTSYFLDSFDKGLLMSHSCSKELQD